MWVLAFVVGHAVGVEPTAFLAPRDRQFATAFEHAFARPASRGPAFVQIVPPHGPARIVPRTGPKTLSQIVDAVVGQPAGRRVAWLESLRRQARIRAAPRPAAPKKVRKLTKAELAAVKQILNKMRGGNPNCVFAGDLRYTDMVNETVKTVSKGLPPWRPKPRSSGPDVRIAYLIQVSNKKQLSMLQKSYNKLYNAKDTFLYLVDQRFIRAPTVERTLSQTKLPKNVVVREAQHAGFFFWPRVEVVLAGIRQMLVQSSDWDVLIHLSESGYPIHSQEWMRRALGEYRNTSFVEVEPRCYHDAAEASHIRETAVKAVEAKKLALAQRLQQRQQLEQAKVLAEKKMREWILAGEPHSTAAEKAEAQQIASQAVEAILAAHEAGLPTTPKSTTGKSTKPTTVKLTAAKPAVKIVAAKPASDGPAGTKTKAKPAPTDEVYPTWWFWNQQDSVAACGMAAYPVPGVKFPLEATTKKGLIWAHGEEWGVFTRELAEYAVAPELAPFRKLVSLRWGADELFWPTLVSNIPELSQRVVPHSLWFKRWDGHGGSAHSPDVIMWPHHTPTLFKRMPSLFFARKLTLPQSSSTIAMIEEAPESKFEPDVSPIKEGAC